MKTIPATASDEEIKEVIRHWVDLLAQERFGDAAAMLSPETIPGNGSVNVSQHPQWTAELIQAVICNGGAPEVWQGQRRTWKVVAVEESFRQQFEDNLSVSRGHFEAFGQVYCGGVHVDLPWNGERGNCVGDLTARFYLREVEGGDMVLVLEDIHVM